MRLSAALRVVAGRCVRIVALVSGVCAAPAGAFAQAAEVVLALPDHGNAVVAHYSLSTPVRTLRFAGNGDVRRRTWVPEAGATLAADGNAIEFARPTARFSVKLGAFARDGEVDRVYSPVILFGDGEGAAVYSEYVLPKSGGLIRFMRDGVVLGTRRAGGAVAWRANDAATYLLVGSTSLQSTPAMRVSFDASVPSWVRERLLDVGARIGARYGKAFSFVPPARPWLLVSFTQADEAGASFRGDTNPGMVRLNLMGQGWRAQSPGLQGQLDTFVAHELFHQWNAHWRYPGDDGQTWLLEGGADAVAEGSLRDLGLMDPDAYERMATAHFVKCNDTPGVTLGEKFAAGGRSYYECGAAVFSLATRLGDRLGRHVSASDLWAAVFTAGKPGSSYTGHDFEQALGVLLRDAAEPAATGTKLIDDLLASRVSWKTGLERGADAFHLRRATPSDVANADFATSVLDALVLAAVRQDCHGSTSVGYENRVYQIDSLPMCDRIKAPMRATTLDGRSMETDASQAASQALQRCAAGEDLELGDGQGRSLPLACPTNQVKPLQWWLPERVAATAPVSPLAEPVR